MLLGGASLKVVGGSVNNKPNVTNVSKAVHSFTQVNNNIQVKLSLQERSNVSFKVFDIAGKEITRKSFGTLSGNQTLSANLKGIAKGTYFIKVQAGKVVRSLKFVRK